MSWTHKYERIPFFPYKQHFICTHGTTIMTMIAKTMHNYFNNQWEMLQLVNTFKIPWLSVPNVHGHFFWTFLVAQWITICLPIQQTQVPALVQEDSVPHTAARLLCHYYWARSLEPTSHSYEPECYNYWSPTPRTCAHCRRCHHNEKSTRCSDSPVQPKLNN